LIIVVFKSIDAVLHNFVITPTLATSAMPKPYTEGFKAHFVHLYLRHGPNGRGVRIGF
jgi:hypothetical protein